MGLSTKPRTEGRTRPRRLALPLGQTGLGQAAGTSTAAGPRACGRAPSS